MSAHNGMDDPLVVSTSALSEAIKAWAMGHDFATEAIEFFSDEKRSVSEYLAAETGLPNRRIRGILNQDSRNTTLRVADLIISAMDRPDLMPEVIPNPRWNQERWREYMRERGCDD